MDIEAAVAKRNFGEPVAFKRGRRAEWPYVPAIHYGRTGPDKVHTHQIRRKAFATRDEALACAAAAIEYQKAEFRRRLLMPRMRALREQYGLPIELV